MVVFSVKILLFIMLKIVWCSFSVAEEEGIGPKTLYVFSWKNTFSPNAIKRFEEAYACRVEFDYFESHDIMFERVKEPGCGFDIVMSPSGISEWLHEQNLLATLDHEKIPNLPHIQSRTLALFPDVAREYTVPYGVSTLCVGYNKRQIPPDMPLDWMIFEDARFVGRTALLTDMRYTMGAALKSLGCSINTTDAEEIRAAGEVLKRWKRNVKYFSINRSREALANNELTVIQTLHGSFMSLKAKNPDLAFFAPEEGTVTNCSMFSIPSDSSNIDLAHAFINFMIEPETAAETMRRYLFYIPIPEAHKLLAPALLADLEFKIPYEIMMRCESIRSVGEAIDLYDEVWTEVLLGEENNN